MLQITKYKELETFRNLPTTVTSTMTRFNFQLHIEMQEQDYLGPPKRSIFNPKFRTVE